ncbi:DUF4956 domain-containing protein [Parvularcula mediterranea]|nr:DUF4956 domain-containing protein [Parvularcula mediterranea]
MSKRAEEISARIDAVHREGLWRFVRRVSAYYLAGGGLIAALIFLFPAVIEVLPVGGIQDYGSLEFDPIVAGEITRTGPATAYSWLEDAITLFLAMLCSLALMVPVAWLYKDIHQGQDYDHSIDETTLVMPAVVAGVVTVAQHSLALAFSLAGIVAAVRFRRALSDTFDTLFIFVAIGVGLAAGVGAIEIALVTTVFFTYATAFICIFGDGLESRFVAKRQREEERAAKKARKAKALRAEEKRRQEAQWADEGVGR